MRTCLVTGGAGFIGCAIASGLIERFDRVVVLDSLHPQIHPGRRRPNALPAMVELIVGDVTDANTWDDLLKSVKPDTVVHLAAETGTGQSLKEASRHTHVNVTGTATMLDAFAAACHTPEHFILTSSRAVYGEGGWRRSDGTLVYPGQRSREQLAKGVWDFPELKYAPVSAASTTANPVSVYGATKLAQEHTLKSWVASLGGELTILRLQNVYGPGQSLANPYTGIVSLFCRLARSGQSIPLYEDGGMLRDFILIDDVAAAVFRSIESPAARGQILDVGTGGSMTIEGIAQIIATHYGAPGPHVCGKYRYGDVRHAACDLGSTEELLQWSCAHDVKTGVEKLASWIETQLNT